MCKIVNLITYNRELVQHYCKGNELLDSLLLYCEANKLKIISFNFESYFKQAQVINENKLIQLLIHTKGGWC